MRPFAADSKFAVAYNARGFAYYLLRDYARALADFHKAIESVPATRARSTIERPH
jgi:hypothetical protein